MLLLRWSTSVDHHLFFYFFFGVYMASMKLRYNKRNVYGGHHG
nr:MAG TPA: hypothetical protein [Caudoviricetes sp.]